MKKLLITLILTFFTTISYSQIVYIDSIQVYNVLPKGNLVKTVTKVEEFNNTLNKLSVQEKTDVFIVKYFYKSEKNGPNKIITYPIRKKPAVKPLMRRI